MNIKSCRNLLATLVIGLAATAQAQEFATKPETGLWRTEVTSEINGTDVIAALREAQLEMMQQLPPEQRALMEAMLEGETPGIETECLASEDLEHLVDMQELFSDMRSDMRGCDLSIDETGRDHMTFSGQCQDHDGFTGDVSGEVRMVSSREMRHTFEGSGRYEMGEDLPPGFEGMDGDVTMEHQTVSRWVAAECN